jgi:hypothetical protein
VLVHYKNPNVLRAFGKNGSVFMFVPGTNELSKAVWDDLMENKNFKRRVDSGLMKVVSEKDSVDPESTSSLADFGTAEAKQIARDTYDPVLLRQWLKTESRKTVAAVIEEQLKQAEQRIAERTKKSDDDEE